MNRPSFFAYLSLFAAAVASLATSAPPPDWTLDDESSGDVILDPASEEATIRVRVKAIATRASLAIEVSLPPSRTAPSRTPIEFFASAPLDVTEAADAAPPAPQRFSAFPGGSSSAELGASPDERVYEVHFRWESPYPEDRKTTTSVQDGDAYRTVEVTRELAPRRRTNIHWTAKVHAEGYDDKPSGALVDVEPAR